jgi:DNA-directed RNA polymerase specialized sigma24 family protein
VQEAAASWFAAHGQFRTTAEFSAYLRLAIVNRAISLQRRHTDALDRDPLSLDAQIEED